MAGMRIRCVCGTVFDPTTRPQCPACGTPFASSTVPDASRQTSPTGRASQPEPEAIPSAGFGSPASQQGLLQRHATLISAIAGVAVLTLVALFIRDRFGPKPGGSTSGLKGGAVAQNDATASRDPLEPDDSAVVPPQSPDAPPGATPLPVTPAPPAPRPSDLPAFKGNWKLLTARMKPESVIPGLPVTRSTLAQTVAAAFAGTGAVSTMTIHESGSYVLEVDVTGDGFVTSNITPNKNLLSVAAQGVLTFSPSGVEVTDRVRAMLRPVKFDMPQMDVKANDTELSLLPMGGSGGATSVWFRPGDSGYEHGTVTGTWSYPQVFIDSYLPYRGTLELQDGGNYRIRFTRTEEGLLNAAGGDYEFKRSINMGPLVQGRYEFDGPNRFTLIEPRGTATWVRAEGEAVKPTGNRPPPRGVRR